ncbi:tetratricopeptide repeat protein [Cognatishimia activa]|uniref:Tetratricopeptide repeat protein n=1 Tax=Cognatishimia activa TaxID=1715691 RepID=A0A975I7X9_9RHOB|nr:tetratricopeptide repeat protein [Cognatishimia activa]
MDQGHLVRFTLLKSFVIATSLLVTSVPASAQGLAGNYLAGRAAASSYDYEAASLYYTRLLVANPSDPFLLESLVLANLSLGNMDKAIPIARRLDAIDDVSSQLANMALIADLSARGRFDEVMTRIQAEEGIGPLVDGLILAWAALGDGDMNATVAGFDAVAQEPGLAGFALYHKALAMASVGDFAGAEDIYSSEGALGMQLTRRGAMAQIEILSQLDRNDDGLEILDALFGKDLDPQLRQVRADLADGKRLPFTHVRSASEGIAEVFYSLADALRGEADPDYALLYTRTAEFLRPDHVDALLLSAELLEDLEQYELATQAYRSVPADHISFHAAELGRAEALRHSGRIDAAIEVLEQLARTHGDLPIVHNTLGDVFRQQQDYARAAQAYDKALSMMTDPSDGKWFTLYARGITNERLGDWPAAEADFRAALELNPDQPQVLNYLGYSLVEKRIKLDEALGMIERAVEARPDSGYIVDSLGWVLYRLGRFDEAVDPMERAAALMPVDPIVNDHLGDVYWKVGRKTEARFQWHRALSFIDEDSAPEADPDRIRQKLDVGLDAVLEAEGNDPVQVANDG